MPFHPVKAVDRRAIMQHFVGLCGAGGFGKLDENVQSVTLYMICHLRFDVFSATVLPVTGNTNHPVPSVVWDGVGNLTKGVK